ncbi:MAG: chemotaxis protein CheB [Polyangiaceae bacterium]|nr:chemotaxis protein CheB [Polyangiaceae bacterium]
MSARHYAAVAIGGSAGGLEALSLILAALPGDFALPILAVQHLHPTDSGYLAEHLGGLSALAVSEARDKEIVRSGHVYLAPANYHLLVEKDHTLSLSVDEKVSWARPSIDVLFDSAARAWGQRLIGVILSGANHDGTEGMRVIKRRGGLTIAQDPRSAQHTAMPSAAIDAHQVDVVLEPKSIADLLIELGGHDPSGGA